MKTKLAIALLCIALNVPLMGGCGQNNSHSANEVSIVQSGNESSEGIPEEVKQKLTAVLEKEPVAVPADGWTDAKLLDVIYINGEKLTMPFKVKDLGEGIDIRTDGDNYVSGTSLSGQSSSTATLTYYGTECGIATVREELSPEEFESHGISFISFSTLSSETPEIYPISINGVTIGASYDDIVERLGFTVEENQADPNVSNKSFVVTGYTESYYVRIIGFDATINHITFGLRTSE